MADEDKSTAAYQFGGLTILVGLLGLRLGGHLALFYIRQVKLLNSYNCCAMTTAP